MIAGSLTRSVPSSRWSPSASSDPSFVSTARRVPGGKLPIVPPSSATSPWRVAGAPDVVEIALEVSDDTGDLEARVVGGERSCGIGDDRL